MSRKTKTATTTPPLAWEQFRDDVNDIVVNGRYRTAADWRQAAKDLRAVADLADAEAKRIEFHAVDVALDVAERTQDAYMCDDYGRHWQTCAMMLATRGYDARQIEAIMRSKWMRWAADSASTERPTHKDLAAFLDDARNVCTPAEVDRLVRETFPTTEER